MRNRQIAILFCCLLVLCVSSSATVSINTAWDVRPTVGAATNGGGFVIGATGTNMAIFNNKNAAACSSCQSATVNISTTDGVTAGTTTITSVTGNYSSALIGNIVYIQGGTGSVTAVWKQVITVPGSTSFTVDSSTGLTAGTGVTVNIGGALATLANVNTAGNQVGNQIFMKASGTLTVGASAFTLNNNVNPNNGSPINTLTGYVTTWGDLGPASDYTTFPMIQATSGTSYYLLTASGAGWLVQYMRLDCNSKSGVGGVSTGWYTVIQYSLFENCPQTPINLAGNSDSAYNNRLLNNTANAGIACAGPCTVKYNYIYNQTGSGGSGVQASGDDCDVSENIIDTVTSGAGIVVSGFDCRSNYNTVYNTNTFGIKNTNRINTGEAVGNIISTAGTYCLDGGSAGTPAGPRWDGNFFLACTTANRHFIDDTGSTNPINGAAPYTNIKDVQLTADPFTNKTSHNFTLNNTAGGGAAVRSAGVPSILGGNTGTSYRDGGPYQSQATSSSANSSYVQ